MTKPEIDLHKFERLFPFCFVADAHGKIIHLGPSLKKLAPNSLGRAFEDLFEVTRPKDYSFNGLIQNAHGEMINLKFKGENFELMGQTMPLDRSGDYLFVTNLVVQDAELLTQLKLNFNDFAIQDPVFDFLMLVQTQKRSIRQAEDMNRKLVEAIEVATKASKTKSQFLANMSHELRTPMNGFLGMASILMETNLDDMQKECVRTMMQSGEAMLSLVNDILDLSKVEAGQIQLSLSRFDLNRVINEVVSSVATLAEKKGLKLVVDTDPQIQFDFFSDPLRLRQVIMNLVGNAIKFTSKGSVTIDVKAKNISKTTCDIECKISDTGPGMPTHLLDQLFTPFVQGDSSMTKKFEGTGLGLSICKRILESMDGQIEVSSEIGKGSEFRFRVPLKRSA